MASAMAVSSVFVLLVLLAAAVQSCCSGREIRAGRGAGVARMAVAAPTIATASAAAAII